MFTGLVETIGTVMAAERPGRGCGCGWTWARPPRASASGDSIALGGVCQTVAAIDGRAAAFDAVAETLARTTMGRWQTGTRVNVERSLRPGDRLGGHFVAGHVDGTGRIVENREREGGWWLRVEAPEALLPEIAPKGSIAIDGVSLTVVDVAGATVERGAHPDNAGGHDTGRPGAGRPREPRDRPPGEVRAAGARGGGLGRGGDDRRLLDALGRGGFRLE